MKFLDALRQGPQQVQRNDMSFQDWINAFQQNALSYPGQWPGYQFTYGKDPAEPIANSFAGYVAGGLQSNGIIFSLELKRIQVFSQARFQYQRMRNGRPGDLFGDRSLTVLERPWPGGTTGDMLARMILDADFAGNSWKVPLDGEIVRLRPDYVEIVLKPRMMPLGPDGEDVQVGFKQIGILYYEGGIYSGVKPAVFLPGEYSHFAPIPDPLAAYRGMSWLTPVIRELQADTSATKHKLKFFENAATPNLAVSLPKEITPDQFKAFVAAMDAKHKGVEHAYDTLYTGGGADVTVIGQNMQQLDFKVTQGAGETRLAAAAGIHPVVAGLSEGMQGSSLNAGNYTAAKRNTVDTTFRHLWQNAAGSLEPLVSPPADTRLWYDARDIPFLHEDQKDVAQIQQAQASAWRQLVDGGMDPDAATAFIQTNDLSALTGNHSGLYSVQLQPPTDRQEPASVPAARSRNGEPAESDVDDWDDDPIGDLDEDTEALIYALFRYAPKATRALSGAAFNAKHKRGPGGRFITMVDRVINALNDHKKNGGKGDPFKDFDREQLRKAAKARGIELKRGESRDSIAEKLLADLGTSPVKTPAKTPAKAVAKKATPRPRKPVQLTPEQELAQWKADASKPGRVPVASTGPTKREYYVSSWEEGIARVRKEIAEAEANGREDLLPQLQKDLAYQVKMRNHWRDNPDPDLDQPVHGPTFALAQKVDPARPLAVYGNVLHMEGSDDAWIHLNMTELARIPAELHAVVGAHMAAKADGGIWIGDTAVSRMDHSHDLAGEAPRGWTDGNTFDDVNGVYRPDRRTMLVGRTANSERRGDKTASHEFGHALDAALGDPSKDDDWANLHQKAKGEHVGPYYRQEGHAGRQEFWAEAFSTWVTARQQKPGSDTIAKYIIRLGVSGETGRLIHEYFNQVAAKWGVA